MLTMLKRSLTMMCHRMMNIMCTVSEEQAVQEEQAVHLRLLSEKRYTNLRIFRDIARQR